MIMVFIVWIVFIHLEENQNLLNKKVCENKDFCNILNPSVDSKILVFNQCQEFDKKSSFIYTGLVSLIKKLAGSKIKPEILFATKVIEKIPSVYSMSTILILFSVDIKHDEYRGEE